ncbi:MAG: methionyl-tRNA formyltransferase [Parvularcula sp.]
MRITFMGTPSFAVPSLAALVAAGHEVAAVYTQPPRPSGRGHKLRKSPVHQFADDHGLDVRCPENFKAAADKEAFAALDAEVAVVVAYGLILPGSILIAPRHGCLNLHGSLLPRWRGAAPIQRAIMAGDAVTGVQVMQMERGLDTGPVLLSESVAIKPDDTAGSLSDRLSMIGADLLPRALSALGRGTLTPTPQSEEGITYAHKIDATEARVSWDRPASEIDQMIRGLNPVPGAWGESGGARLKFWMSTALKGTAQEPPGTILRAEPEGIDVATKDGIVRLLRLQRPGKTAQDAETFLRGFDLPAGSRFAD